MLCEKYEFFPKKSEWTNKVLFIETLEDISTPNIYGKMLNALKVRGIFDEINAVIVGKPLNEIYYDEYKEIVLKVIDNKMLPILYNVNFGHVYPHCILPYGAKISYNHNNKKSIL